MKLRVVPAGQCVGFPASFTQLMAGSASTTQLSAWKLLIAGSSIDIRSPVKDLIHHLQEFVLAATVTYLNCDLVPCLSSQKKNFIYSIIESDTLLLNVWDANFIVGYINLISRKNSIFIFGSSLLPPATPHALSLMTFIFLSFSQSRGNSLGFPLCL